MGGFYCGIAAAQRAYQGDPARGHRHEYRLHQGSERQPRERSGGVRPNPEGREPVRRWEAGAARANSVDVAQEPSELI